MSNSQENFLRAKKKATLVGGLVNLLLAIGKIIAGYYGRSQSLIVDGIHSLSDLGTDLLILLTFKISGQSADESHPYGHGRFETIATVILGLFLVGLAVGIVWDASQRLQGLAPLWHPQPLAMVAACLSILAKEGLYHYTVRLAHRTRSKLLRANAWHHRSDAISSIIVVIGVIGSLYGYVFADAVAAIVVGLMIAKIGLGLIIESARELVDTALPAHRVEQIRRVILESEGVKSLHALRSRQMAGEALVDVHIQVPPEVSVSEGHAIADRVRDKLLEEFEEITDVTVHIDAEYDQDQDLNNKLPLRGEVLNKLGKAWSHLPFADKITKINLHYLKGQIHIEVYLPLSVITPQLPAEEIVRKLRNALKTEKPIGFVQVFFTPEATPCTKKEHDAPFLCNLNDQSQKPLAQQ